MGHTFFFKPIILINFGPGYPVYRLLSSLSFSTTIFPIPFLLPLPEHQELFKSYKLKKRRGMKLRIKLHTFGEIKAKDLMWKQLTVDFHLAM